MISLVISEESTLAKYRRLLTACLFLYPAGATDFLKNFMGL